MISIYLASENLLIKPALYLSDYFERNKTAYIDHLMAVRMGNHMHHWLIFFLQGVKETAASSIQVFRAILSLKEQIEREILPSFSHRRQMNAQKIMRKLYANPIIDVKGAALHLETTPNTASAIIDDLIRFGVLREITGQQRNRLFIFENYVQLFRRPN